MAQIDTLTQVGAVVATDLGLILRGGANVLGTFGSLVGQNANAVAITGGAVSVTSLDGILGGNTPAAVNGTTGAFSGDLEILSGATVVGRIKSRAAAVTTIILDPRANGSGITGTANGFLPVDEQGNSSDGVIVLGAPTQQFKDIHLSGSVNAASATISGNVTLGDGHTIGDDAFDNLKITASAGENLILDGEALLFYIAGGEQARIDASGNLVVSAASGNKSISVDSDSLANNEQATFFAYGGARNSAIGVFKHSGISNASSYLGSQRQNGTQDFVWVSDAGNYMLSTNASNIGTANCNVIGAQTSDETLKNIEVNFEYGIAEIMRLRPIAYSMKDDPSNKRMLGFGAQTSRLVVPELVYDTGECVDGYDVDTENGMIQTPRTNKTKLGMEYVQAIPILVNAMQQQQGMIEILTQRIDQLEAA
jgi:hypothetical protein